MISSSDLWLGCMLHAHLQPCQPSSHAIEEAGPPKLDTGPACSRFLCTSACLYKGPGPPCTCHCTALEVLLRLLQQSALVAFAAASFNAQQAHQLCWVSHCQLHVEVMLQLPTSRAAHWSLTYIWLPHLSLCLAQVNIISKALHSQVLQSLLMLGPALGKACIQVLLSQCP